MQRKPFHRLMPLAGLAAGIVCPSPLYAGGIYRWDNGQLIPGTENITPAPGVDVSRMDLRYGNLAGYDLSSGNFNRTNLGNADLRNANLAQGSFDHASLADVQLANASLVNADLTRARLFVASFNGVNMTGAIVRGAITSNATEYSLTASQLYSTKSYQDRDLTGIDLSGNLSNLAGWNFSNQDLTHAIFQWARLTGANFTDAVVQGVVFNWASDLTETMLRSTKSYKDKNITGIMLRGSGIVGWDFSGQNLSFASLYTGNNSNFSNANLTGAYLVDSNFNGANLGGAIIQGANLAGTTSKGFTAEMLYSTKSYQERNLTGVHLSGIAGWDLSGQDLTNAGLYGLTNVNFTGAIIQGASFQNAVASGFTFSQLYSTASYQSGNLSGIRMRANDLSGWDFSGQDLRNSDFYAATLTNANLAGAMIQGADWRLTTSRGFSAVQLQSTRSYQDKDLSGINFSRNDFTGWSFAGQNLTNVKFSNATLTNTDFSNADLSGVDLRNSTGFVAGAGTILHNTILADGSVQDVMLNAGEHWIVMDNSPKVTVTGSATFAHGSTLTLIKIGYPISFAQGVTPQLGGTLEILLDYQQDISNWFVATTKFFEWSTPLSADNRFDNIIWALPPGYTWNLDNLYVDGTAVIETAPYTVPEPASLSLLALAVSSLLLRRRRDTNGH
jgi:uncharacterized protein YjbI with pentapeptide repeats